MKSIFTHLMRQLDDVLPGQSPEVKYGYASLAAATWLSFFAAVLVEAWWMAVLPAVVLLVYVTILDYRKVFYLLLVCIPLSTELELPGGFGTDLPTEPLIVGLMLVFILQLAFRRSVLPQGFMWHPITLLLLLHWGWIIVPLLTSSDVFVSVKFFLAKTWYIITFYFLAGSLLRTIQDVAHFFWAVCIPLMLTVVYVLVGHAGYGFSFEDVHRVLSPFYRNHVIYACIMVVIVPFVWFVRQWYPTWSWQRVGLGLALIVLVVAIQLSYTRAAMGTLILLPLIYGVIRLRLVKSALLMVVLVVTLGFWRLALDNYYLDFAPDYDKTITHTRFDNLLEATAQGEDISTMERFYRWIAGFYMVGERLLTGFGPGNFLEQYKPYAVNSFRTYVSHNPERSGIHCYYLMVPVEQGLPGLLFFLFMVFAVLIYGEKLYHRLKCRRSQQAVMALMLSFISILILCIINDLIETDKIGSFFFMLMAMLVNFDLASRRPVAKPD